MSESLDFTSLKLLEIPVTLEDKKFTLREPTTSATKQWRSAQVACTQLGPDGKPVRVVGIGQTEALLVSLCLFDDQGKNVPVSVLDTWPGRVVSTLYKKALELGELANAANTASIKNALANMEASSGSPESSDSSQTK